MNLSYFPKLHPFPAALLMHSHCAPHVFVQRYKSVYLPIPSVNMHLYTVHLYMCVHMYPHKGACVYSGSWLRTCSR